MDISGPRKVVVVGGGLAGLFAAWKLAKAGYSVTVLEADSENFGGKTRGWIENGAVKEHSMRVYMSCYVTIYSLLMEVEDSGGSSFRDVLMPVKMDYIPTASGIGEHLNLYSLMRRFCTGSDVLRLMNVLRKFLVSSVEEMDRISVKDLFDREGISASGQEFAWAVMGIWVGAKPCSRASAIMGNSLSIVLLSMLGDTWSDSALRMVLFAGHHNHLYAMYPTNAVLIDPIVEHLRSLGVNLCLGTRVADVLRSEDGMCSGVRTLDAAGNSSLFEGDAFVLAVDTMSAQILCPEAFPPHYTSVGEWSVGCNFSLDFGAEVPAFLFAQDFRPGEPRMVLDSPWQITYTLLRPEHVKHTQLMVADADLVSLLITASNLELTPGRIFRKPGLLCSPEELKAEFLEQIGFSTTDAQIYAPKGTVGSGVKYVCSADLAAEPWKYSQFTFGPVQDDLGHRWASASLLYVETCHSPCVLPTTATPNLFLAGEYISSQCTNLKVPTMEKSAETGVPAARHVCDFFEGHDRNKGR